MPQENRIDWRLWIDQWLTIAVNILAIAAFCVVLYTSVTRQKVVVKCPHPPCEESYERGKTDAYRDALKMFQKMDDGDFGEFRA